MTDELEDKQAAEKGDALAAMLKLAGPSPEIDKDLEERVYANVKQAWRRDEPRSRPARWALPLGLAASILAAIGIINSANNSPATQAVGTVMVAQGDVTDHGHLVGDTVFAGEVLDTLERQGMSVEVAEHISLRIDANSLLRIDNANELTLLAGRIYIDSGDRIYAGQHVTVHTATGTATDVGTQFSVRYANADMSVAVRDGQVDVREGARTHSAVRGERLTIRPGAVARFEEIPTSGQDWDWVATLAPVLDIENISLLEFLKWVARESGMKLKIEGEAMRGDTRRTRIHGSIEGLSPIEALDTVLPTTNFAYSIEGDNLIIVR